MHRVPFILVISRIFIACVIAAVALLHVDSQESLIAALLIIGLLTDVFDGIIARKLHVATEKLRVWDSNVDVFFWVISIAAVFYLNLVFLKAHLPWIILLVTFEALVYLVSFLKFKRTVATHTYLAKGWTLILLAFIIELVLTSQSNVLFFICIFSGIISRLEIMIILFRLKSWKTDVSSVFALKRINSEKS